MNTNVIFPEKRGFCFSFRTNLVAIIIVLTHFAAQAQYYPSPKPVNPNKEKELLIRLRKINRGLDKVALLLDLSNLYFNKPLKMNADLDRAMIYAKLASDNSKSLKDESGYNNAQLLIADIFNWRKDMKSAENILPLLNDTAKINLMLNLSFTYWFWDEENIKEYPAKSLFFAKQAQQLSIKYHQIWKEILAQKDIAMIHGDLKNTSAEAELFDVLRRYKKMGYLNLHYIYSQLSIYYLYNGNPAKALDYGLRTIKSMKLTRDTAAAGDFYLWLANIYIENEDYEHAIEFARLAISNYKVHSGEFSLTSPTVIGLIPRALCKLKKYPEAVSFIKKMLKEYPPQNDNDKYYTNSELGNIYRDMKDYNNAEKYFIRSLAFFAKKETKYGGLYEDLGQLYVESGKYAKAIPYLNKGMELSGRLMSSAHKSHIDYMFFLADSATRDYLSAIKHLNKYRGAKEYDLRQSRDREIQKLQIQYETKAKENEIKFKDQDIRLLNQKNQIQQVNLREANFIKNAIIAGILPVFIILGLLYRQYKLKKQTNEIITHKNAMLEQLLSQKEWLLKEVHHRVKNNLHTVISLLEYQAAFLENDALEAIENSQHRIYAMSLTHQKLYLTDDVQTIDMSVYIDELIGYLRDSFGLDEQIGFKMDIEPIRLGISQAIPLGLIINEAVTNSIKYAFLPDMPGIIIISFSQLDDDITLLITDNGKGIDEGTEDSNIGSLGIKLMNGLSEDIGAKIKFENIGGTKITISFKKDPLNEFDSPMSLLTEKEG